MQLFNAELLISIKWQTRLACKYEIVKTVYKRNIYNVKELNLEGVSYNVSNGYKI